MKSKLTFENKFLKKHPKQCSEDRTYIDFIINGKPLSELLGGVGFNIGQFGWKKNIKFEINELKNYRNKKNLRVENGLFSAYVCAECGDEGCGAVMFNITENENHIIWENFVWSDGYLENEDDPDEKIDLEPIEFNKIEYEVALNELEKMILKK